MVLGEMVMESTKYGMDSACRPYEDASLETLLAGAVENIQAEIAEQETDELVEEEDGIQYPVLLLERIVQLV